MTNNATQTDKISIGEQAELKGLEFLKSKGLKLAERNYRCKSGEIDLIMKDKDTLVFVEVRFRRTNSFGSAAESVTPSKQKKILSASQHYLVKHNLSDRIPVRFDVIAMSPTHETHWIKGAF